MNQKAFPYRMSNLGTKKLNSNKSNQKVWKLAKKKKKAAHGPFFSTGGNRNRLKNDKVDKQKKNFIAPLQQQEHHHHRTKIHIQSTHPKVVKRNRKCKTTQ